MKKTGVVRKERAGVRIRKSEEAEKKKSRKAVKTGRRGRHKERAMRSEEKKRK